DRRYAHHTRPGIHAGPGVDARCDPTFTTRCGPADDDGATAGTAPATGLRVGGRDADEQYEGGGDEHPETSHDGPLLTASSIMLFRRSIARVLPAELSGFQLLFRGKSRRRRWSSVGEDGCIAITRTVAELKSGSAIEFENRKSVLTAVCDRRRKFAQNFFLVHGNAFA